MLAGCRRCRALWLSWSQILLPPNHQRSKESRHWPTLPLAIGNQVFLVQTALRVVNPMPCLLFWSGIVDAKEVSLAPISLCHPLTAVDAPGMLEFRPRSLWFRVGLGGVMRSPLMETVGTVHGCNGVRLNMVFLMGHSTKALPCWIVDQQNYWLRAASSSSSKPAARRASRLNGPRSFGAAYCSVNAA